DGERLAMLRAMQKKTNTTLESADVEKYFLEQCSTLSGADIEAVLVRARMKSALESKPTVDQTDLEVALKDFIPPSYPTEIELQNLGRVKEGTNKNRGPEKSRNRGRGKIIAGPADLAMQTD